MCSLYDYYGAFTINMTINHSLGSPSVNTARRAKKKFEVKPSAVAEDALPSPIKAC